MASMVVQRSLFSASQQACQAAPPLLRSLSASSGASGSSSLSRSLSATSGSAPSSTAAQKPAAKSVRPLLPALNISSRSSALTATTAATPSGSESSYRTFNMGLCGGKQAPAPPSSLPPANNAAAPPQLRSFSTARLTVAELPSKVREAEYAVRGRIVAVAEEIQRELDSGNHEYSFSKLIPCNIGNPQAVGATPLTFHRQVLSLVTNPSLLHDETAIKAFPRDVVERASKFLAATKGVGLGAYSASKGVLLFRQMCADAVNRRDGNLEPLADPDDFFLTDGASSAVKTVLELLIRDDKDVVFIPIPQYPLYSASVTRLGGTWLGYELEEDYGAEKPAWGVDVEKLERQVLEAQERGQRVGFFFSGSWRGRCWKRRKRGSG